MHYVTASWVSYHEHYVIRSIPLVRSKCSLPRTNDLTRRLLIAVGERQKTKTKKKRYPGCLFNGTRSERHVLQWRYQPTPTQPLHNRGRSLDARRRGIVGCFVLLLYSTGPPIKKSLLLRGTIVNRTYGIHKNLLVRIFTIFY